MSIVTGIATFATALGAVLAGLGTLIAATRSPGRADREISSRSVERTLGLDGARISGQAPASPGESLAFWTLILGLSAWLLACVLVTIIGATTTTLNAGPVLLLNWGIIAFAILAIGCGALSARRVITDGHRPGNLLRAGAGIVASIGALAAALIAGISL